MIERKKTITLGLPRVSESEAKNARQPREAHSDTAEADDDQRPAAELLLAQRAVANHAAPAPLPLVVTRLVKLPRESEGERHRVLGNCAFVHALSVGEPNAAPGEQRLVVLIRASAEGLHEAQLRKARDQRVAP